MRLTVRKLSNNEEHTFDWIAFRPAKIVLGPSGAHELEIASSFIVTLDQPHRYVIVFNDSQTQSQMRPHLQRCLQGWHSLVMHAAVGGTINVTARPFDFSAIRNDYMSSQDYTAVFDTLNRLCYWDPGKYELALAVETDGRTFSQKSRFEITDEGFQSLRWNLITMLGNGERTYTGTQPIYYFAYPQRV